MAYSRSLTCSTVLTLLALLISLVTTTPIQNDEHHEDAGVAEFPLHTVHLIPDAGPSFRPHRGSHGFHGPVKARQDSAEAGFPLHTVHLTPASGTTTPPTSTIQPTLDPSDTGPAVTGSPLLTINLHEVTDQPAVTSTPATNSGISSSPPFTLNLSEINDRPPGTTTLATDSGVAGYPQHTVHLTPASDSPSPQLSTISVFPGIPTSITESEATMIFSTQAADGVVAVQATSCSTCITTQPSTITLTHSSTSVFPGIPTNIPESEATMIFMTQAAEGTSVLATTSSACTTSITRLPSDVSGLTKVVYASTTTFTVLYPCGTCSMEVVEPTAPIPAPSFTTTLTIQGVTTYATAICTSFPWLDAMNGSQALTATSASVTSKSHRHTHSHSRVAVRSESKPTSNAEEPLSQEELTGNEEEPACKTTLYAAQPFETGIVKTVWTATKTITDVVHCDGCQLTVINPNGVGPEVFHTRLETIKGTSTTTTRICKPTPAATGYLGPFDLWF